MSEMMLIIEQIEQEMKRIKLWQSYPPKPDAFFSQQPFAIDTMQSHEWLQWIFIPRIKALQEAKATLPRQFALHPYFSETMKEQKETQDLLRLIKALDDLVA